MSAQIVHIDLIEGAAWLPWMLLAVHGLTDAGAPGAPTRHRRAGSAGGPVRRGGRRWVVLLAVSLGLTLLSRRGRGDHRQRGAGRSSTGSGGLVTTGLLRRGNATGPGRPRWWPWPLGVAGGRGPRAPPSGSPGSPSCPSRSGPGHLLLLHQRLAPRPPGDPAGVALRPRHQPGPARPPTPAPTTSPRSPATSGSWPSSPPAPCSSAGGGPGPRPASGGSGT